MHERIAQWTYEYHEALNQLVACGLAQRVTKLSVHAAAVLFCGGCNHPLFRWQLRDKGANWHNELSLNGGALSLDPCYKFSLRGEALDNYLLQVKQAEQLAESAGKCSTSILLTADFPCLPANLAGMDFPEIVKSIRRAGWELIDRKFSTTAILAIDPFYLDTLKKEREIYLINL